MKRNAIARIIIFSIIIVLLLGILGTALGIGMFAVSLDIGDSDYTTAQTSTVLFSPEEVKNIQIEWASGDIHIQAGDVDAINITESGANGEQEAMAYKQTGDTVTVIYQEPKIQIGFFSTVSKDLNVTVPREWYCDELSMDVASADVTVDGLTANSVSVSTASGDYRFTACEIGDLDIDTASGSIEYDGTLTSLDCDAASGSFTGVFRNTPKSLSMDSASADLDITLPADTGFVVNMDSLSGTLRSDFPASIEHSNSYYIYGDGRCEIDLDGASGSIYIRKGA